MTYNLDMPTYVPLTAGVHPIVLRTCSLQLDSQDTQYLRVEFTPKDQPDFVNAVVVYDHEKFQGIRMFIARAQSRVNQPGLSLGDLFKELDGMECWVLISKNPGVNKDGKDTVYTNKSIYFTEPELEPEETALVSKEKVGKRA